MTNFCQIIFAAHCAYQCKKISGPKGVITIQGCPKVSLHCDKRIHCDKRSLDMATQHQPDKEMKDSRPKAPINSHGKVKIIPFDPGEPSKTIQIGSNLDPK